MSRWFDATKVHDNLVDVKFVFVLFQDVRFSTLSCVEKSSCDCAMLEDNCLRN